MTPAEALLAFTVEVTRAAREVDLAETPRVILADIPPGVLAETVPGEIRLAYHAAWTAADLGGRRSRPWLRCIARHEVSHRRLGHAPTTAAGLDEAEAQVAILLAARWNERDPHCGARLR